MPNRAFECSDRKMRNLSFSTLARQILFILHFSNALLSCNNITPRAILLSRGHTILRSSSSQVIHSKLKIDQINSILYMLPSSSLFFQIQAAAAVDGEYGILEGKTAALIHPLVMMSLFATTIFRFLLSS